jgi:hypothetical protein
MVDRIGGDFRSAPGFRLLPSLPVSGDVYNIAILMRRQTRQKMK